VKLRRHPANPLLLPDPASSWETYGVFNPSVIHHNGLFHMHYRAQGLDWVSRIGYAVSPDGVQWNRLREPVLSPQGEPEARGVEDPRVTAIEGSFVMAYTAFGKSPVGDFRITPMFARSANLLSWERLGPLVQGEDNKDHLLFPRRFDGHYLALHRRAPQIWLAESDDLRHWPAERMRPLLGPRPGNGWDSLRVGANGVPIETDAGWLMLYHAYDLDHVYRFGACLLDRDDPGRVLKRPRDPIFEPEELWEIKGDVPNVVFSCANPAVDGQIYIYYGAADRVIGLATIGEDELLAYVLQGE
jgi:predicted GH43/DUF377 family glycosyl hydrolase